MGARKILAGVYQYKNYILYNCGYYSPEQCVCWEAENIKTGCADFHAYSKTHLMGLVDTWGESCKKISKNIIKEKHDYVAKEGK